MASTDPHSALHLPLPVIAVVMGVSGSGKTTIADRLARALDCQMQEGDKLHGAANIAKMKAGMPLTDADRLPWLEKIAAKIDRWRALGVSGVLSCSALKRSYRDIIIGHRTGVQLVYLKGSYTLIHQRITARHGHFMPSSLLDSQFADLEEPGPDEDPIIVNVAASPGEIATTVLLELQRRSSASARLHNL